MFDNLRDQEKATPFYEEQAQFQEAAGKAPPPDTAGGRFLGMTAQQRFLVTFMVLVAVCVLGAMCLLITGRISLF